MYLIDVYAVDREHGTMERLAFEWGCHGNAVERVHEDGHHSPAGFASSIGWALDKVGAACSLVGLEVTSAMILREEEGALNGQRVRWPPRAYIRPEGGLSRGLGNGA